jgi:hypothetical protein
VRVFASKELGEPGQEYLRAHAINEINAREAKGPPDYAKQSLGIRG